MVQGTTYPDVVESAGSGVGGVTATIKSHHNVGGLPERMRLTLVEPLRYLFKDEVRKVGVELGLPPEMVYRQPFPGPGLAIRIIGAVTRAKLETLRAADWVVMDEIKDADLYGISGSHSRSSPTPDPSACRATPAPTDTSWRSAR